MSLFRLSAGLSILVIAGLSLVHPHTAQALLVEDVCTKAEVIFARGSGQQVEQEDREAIRFFEQVSLRIAPSQIVPHRYELGKEVYGGHQYPAEDVSNLGNGNSIGAFVSAGYANDYGKSVDKGVGELYNYLTQRYNKCKSSGTLFILGGVSQGAQVIGQTLSKFSEEVRDRIIFTGLFGDPKLYLPEGDGWWNPPACQGKNFSLYRRTIGDCHLHSGRLGARIPYLPIDMHTKTGLWCYDRDFVCGTSPAPWEPGHEEYKNEGRAIDTAAQEAITRLKHRLEQDYIPPTPQPGQPMPIPSYSLLDVKHSFGQGTTGQNVVFMVDISSSMSPYLANIQQFIDQKGAEITARGGQYTVALYYGIAGGFISGPIPPAIVAMSQLGANQEQLYRTDYQPPYVGPYAPPTAAGSSLDAITLAFNDLQWRNGATKSLMLFTDNQNIQSLEPGSATLQDVVRKSLAIDPVNIFPVVPETVADAYEDLAKGTAGQVSSFTNDSPIEAANHAYTKILSRPVPLLKNTEYSATPGQEITFDASDSYVIDANITKYEWDFNGDNVFEATTTSPSINHTYTNQFEGLMQVRITADNDTVANMSAKVAITNVESSAPPNAPKNLTYKIDSTSDNKSTVTINWQGDTPVPDRWVIGVDSTDIGYAEGSQTSLQITDVERTRDTVISIAGSTSNREIGEYRSITIPILKTEPEQPPVPPILSRCNQSNFFIRILCQVIAILRTYINGILYYILPYRI